MRHAEHSAASWQISILAYWHISNLLTMQHYKALFTLGIHSFFTMVNIFDRKHSFIKIKKNQY